VPSLLLDGIVTPILHVSQLASMLGLDLPAQLDASRLAWDASSILEGWLAAIGPLDLEMLTRPTPSRDRSLRKLTVNVFHPFELLPGAFDDGWFDWDPAADEARETQLGDQQAVVAYAAHRHLAWRDWLLEREEELATRDPVVDSPRGQLTFRNLLASQRFHAAFHYRQLIAVLERQAHDLSGLFMLSSIADLDLPQEVF